MHGPAVPALNAGCIGNNIGIFTIFFISWPGHTLSGSKENQGWLAIKRYNAYDKFRRE
jgi:hypothetical protein